MIHYIRTQLTQIEKHGYYTRNMKINENLGQNREKQGLHLLIKEEKKIMNYKLIN